MVRCWQIVLVCSILLFTSPRSGAQLTERAVSGVVTDRHGNTLPKAIVLLENTMDLSVRSYITDKDGVYHFAGLNADIDFTLKAHYRNYWSETKTLSKFNSSKNPHVTLVIPID